MFEQVKQTEKQHHRYHVNFFVALDFNMEAGHRFQSDVSFLFCKKAGFVLMICESNIKKPG